MLIFQSAIFSFKFDVGQESNKYPVPPNGKQYPHNFGRDQMKTVASAAPIWSCVREKVPDFLISLVDCQKDTAFVLVPHDENWEGVGVAF